MILTESFCGCIGFLLTVYPLSVIRFTFPFLYLFCFTYPSAFLLSILPQVSKKMKPVCLFIFSPRYLSQERSENILMWLLKGKKMDTRCLQQLQPASFPHASHISMGAEEEQLGQGEKRTEQLCADMFLDIVRICVQGWTKSMPPFLSHFLNLQIQRNF